jgi:hypothetical protein
MGDQPSLLGKFSCPGLVDKGDNIPIPPETQGQRSLKES